MMVGAIKINMVIKCKTNDYYAEIPALILPTTEKGVVEFYNMVIVGGEYSIHGQHVGYFLTVDKEYTVYGVLQYDGRLRYLVRDDRLMPTFVPHSMLEICNPDIPYDWKIRCYEIEEGPLLIIGYDDLADTYDDLCGLIERRSSSLRKFVDYVDWCEKWGVR